MKPVLALAALVVLASGAASAQPKLLDCSQARDRAWCEDAHAMYRKHGPRPTDHTGMRNIAYCLWTGCGGGFEVDRRQSCIFRRHIMLNHVGKTDGSDDMHFANCVKVGF